LPAHAAQSRELPGYITLPFYFMLHFFKPLLLVLMVALCVSPAYAQTQQTEASPPEPYSPYQWEVGTDLLWLINKNQLPAQSLFARYNYQTAAGKSRGVRLRLGLDYMQLDSAQVDHTGRVRDNFIMPFLRLGYEFQQTNGRQVLFYGADIHHSYSRLNFSRLIQGSAYHLNGTDKKFQLGLIGFVGYKYFFSNRLSLSAELSAQKIYNRRRYNDTIDEVALPGGGGRASIQVDSFIFRVNPLSVINLSCHF
jgi:hypothetical protein